MKILFFNYEYPPLGGGAANATAQILSEYSKIPDLMVDLVTSSADAEFHEEKMGGNVTVYKLPIGKNSQNLHFQSQKDLLVYAWKAYQFSQKLIAKNYYDLTHSFFTVPCGFLSWRVRKKHKIPYVISLRGADVPGYSDRFSLIYWILKPIVKKIWKNAAAVVSNSEGLKKLARETKPDQEISVIYNGVDVENFKPEDRGRDMSKSSPFIITPGASRLTARKGLKYLIEAVKDLSGKYPEIQLKIMGDGDARADLENLAKDLKIENYVKFLGRIPRGKTAPYYQEASVFVLPSLNEGMSNAMLEALASGLPIIATDTGGTKELVKDGENGYIIKMKDSDDIAEKIEKLINDSELRIKMGERSRQKALEMSWKKVAGKYFELYRTIC